MTEEMSTSQLARACAVSGDTIRHYERMGVLPEATRADNGYRRFAPGAVDRMLLVRRALAIGLSLQELATILRVRQAGQFPCRKVRALAGEKLASLDQRIADLLAMRDFLASVLDQWDLRLSATSEGQPAHLLESMSERINHEDNTAARPDSLHFLATGRRR
jgi:DNA-binding transcriptional MerR regulator